MTVILTLAALALALIVWSYIDTRRLVCTHYSIAFRDACPRGGMMKIAQVSDLHDASFGANQARLINELRAFEPDMIAITGDLFNRKDADAYRNAYAFLDEAKKIAPVFMSQGNHEAALRQWQTHRKELERKGVRVLCDEACAFHGIRLVGVTEGFQAERLRELANGGFCLVLAHRPELLNCYADNVRGLVLTGHAHGGQVRLAGQGVFAPEQGLFPKYTAGLFRKNACTMLVSRGLGNTVIPPRVFNTPELVFVTLKGGWSKQGDGKEL